VHFHGARVYGYSLAADTVRKGEKGTEFSQTVLTLED